MRICCAKLAPKLQVDFTFIRNGGGIFHGMCDTTGQTSYCLWAGIPVAPAATMVVLKNNVAKGLTNAQCHILLQMRLVGFNMEQRLSFLQ